MAIKANLKDFDFLPYDDQAMLNTLFDQHMDVKDANQENENEQHGWFLRHISRAFIKGVNAVPSLATGLAELYKSRYSHVYIERENTGGNFCGHDPANPRFIIKNHPYFTPTEIDDLGDKRRPQILYDIVEKVKAYYHDPDVMPVLQIANGDKRTSDRQRRSESRERIISLLTAMIMCMDLGSLRIGQPTKEGGFFNYSMEWLAKKANLSLSRAKRAMSDLNDSMLVHSYQYRELIDKEKKEYIAHNAARVFDFQFFRMLNIDQSKLSKARQSSSSKQKTKAEKHAATLSEKDDAVLKLNMKKVMRGIDPKKPSLSKLNHAKNDADAAKATRLAKRRNEVLFELMQDPALKADSVALDIAVQQCFKELNLLA